MIRDKVKEVSLTQTLIHAAEPATQPRRSDLARARAGDEAAFERLIRALEGAFYRVARTMLGSREDCMDAIQETVLTIWQRMDTVREEQYFQTWAIRVLINHCRGIARKAKSTLPLEYAQQAVAAPGDMHTVLREAIARLKEPERLVVVLFYVEGFSVSETAAILRIPAGTVKSRLHRARKQLGMEMKEEDRQ